MFETLDKTQVYALISSIISEHNFLKKLRLIHILLHSIDEQTAKQIKSEKFHKKIQTIMQNTNFMRELKLNSEIKEHPETAVEYYGKDYMGDDVNLEYKAEFEQLLEQLHLETEEMLGKIINEYTRSEDVGAYGGEEV